MNHRDAPPLGIPAMSRWMRLAPILIVGCTPAAEAEPAIVGEEALLADIPTVVSATRLPQSQVHTPISTTLITREMIKASGFIKIADVSHLVPRFQCARVTGGHHVED